jgi:hypothetical protein
MSLRTFFAKVVSNETYTQWWVEGGSKKDDLIDDDPDLTRNERLILKEGNDFLISLRLALYEPGAGVTSWVPGKEGGPPGPHEHDN